ncbi:hypothetical protein RZN25_15845 [Bacillaceae bacterium S4-13-56]
MFKTLDFLHGCMKPSQLTVAVGISKPNLQRPIVVSLLDLFLFTVITQNCHKDGDIHIHSSFVDPLQDM